MTTCKAGLMRHAACGDQEAFRQLWKAHHDIAQAAALCLCHLCAWAEEITQGALLLAWRGRPRFQQGRPFRPWQRQARSLAFRADTLMVRWLGRGPACSGLHALAERSQAPRRRRWGEPSLVERIERVCRAGVETRENRLTLVG